VASCVAGASAGQNVSDVRRVRLVLAGIALAAFASSLLVSHFIFPLYAGDLDEGVYVYQAHMLLHGMVSLPADRYGAFFRPWLTGQRDGRIFTEYQFGLPLLLAFFLLTLHSIPVGMALVAAGTVVAMYGFVRELLGDRRIALMASGILLLSPIFLIQAGSVLTYPVLLFCFLGAGWALLRGVRTGRYGLLVAGAVALGYGLLTRPPDALLVGVALVASAIHRLRRSVGLRRAAVRVFGAVAVGISPFVALTFWYNWQATGSPASFPNMAADPLNSFGFGNRQLIVGQPKLGYTVGTALRSLVKNLTAVPSWAFGGGVLCLFAIVGAIRLWRTARKPELGALLLIAVGFPLLYLFWWATILSGGTATNGLGPIYYIPSYIPLIILGVVGADWIRALWPRRTVVASLALVGLLVAVTGWPIPDKLSDNLAVTHGFQRTAGLLPAGLGRSLIFIHGSRYLLNPYPFLMTEPGLAGRLIYATDRGAAEARLIRQLPGRQVYVLRPQYEPGDALLAPTGGLTEEHAVSGDRIVVRLTLHHLADTAIGRAYLSVNGRTYFATPRELAGGGGGGGAAGATWVLRAGGGASAANSISLGRRHGVIAVGVQASPGDVYRAPDRQQAVIRFSSSRGELTVIAPGLGWDYVQYPTRAVWLPADVSSLFSVACSAPR
jgi:hypothetical protein